MLDVLESHVTAGLRVFQLGSLGRQFSFEHGHRWPLMWTTGAIEFLPEYKFTNVNWFSQFVRQ